MGADGPEPAAEVEATGVLSGSVDSCRGLAAASAVREGVVRGSGVAVGLLLALFLPPPADVDADAAAPPPPAALNTTSEHE